MKQNKVMRDLQRLLETQNFKNEKEVNEFLSKYQSEGIPEFPEEVLNTREKAEDKVYQAYESSKTKGLKLAEEALKLDPDCIMAYQYLGEQQNNLNNAKEYYEKGIAIGKKKFGGNYEEENKGHFWMIFETRPYMTCLFNLSECEYIAGNLNESIRIIEYLLELNPNDNQGVRYILTSHLLEAKEYLKYEKHSNANSEDGGIFFKFNNALYEFIKSGNSLRSINLLKQAIEHNQYVISKLDKTSKMRSNSYSNGSKEEANYYCEYNAKNWKTVKGAIEWAKTVDKR
jgi:hypothetical protein